MHVAICALTYHRPDGVRSLLAGIGALEQPEGATFEVIVVDNDEDASAEGDVQDAAHVVPWPVQYVVEPRRGIAPARNRAVAVAQAAGADLVAFIDDDEVPEPRWLSELLRVRSAFGADIVTGPVVPVFEHQPPDWATSGAFFERPRFVTGARLTYARTSNVLIAAELLYRPWPPFDERFGLNGGDDTHFFMRVWLAGAHIAWADDAIVSEVVPTSRVSLRWLARRAYRRGNTLSLCLRDLRDSWPNRGRRLGAVVVHIASGSARLLSAVLVGRVQAIKGVLGIAYGLGLFSGLVGVRYDEYRTIHGH